MELLEETKEIVTDAKLADKQFKHYQEVVQKRKGALQNDEFDLVPHERVIDRNSVLNSSTIRDSFRALASAKEPTLQIYRLEEPYPT